jgi:hypothetical protein
MQILGEKRAKTCSAECIPRSKNDTSVIIGRGAFISTPNMEDTEKALSMTDIYIKLQIRFSNDFTSTQYLYPRSFMIK